MMKHESFEDFAIRRAIEKSPKGFAVVKQFPNNDAASKWLSAFPKADKSQYRIFPFDGPADLILEIVTGSPEFQAAVKSREKLMAELYTNEAT